MLHTIALRSLILLALLIVTACSRPQASAATQPNVAEVSASQAIAPVKAAIAPRLGPDTAPAQDVSAASAESASASNATTRHLPSELLMPSLEMDIPVEEIGWSKRPGEDGSVYSQWDEAEYAAGWHKNSAVPGEGGNVVLSGHNNIAGAVFRELDQLSRGDIATLVVDGVTHNYAVDKILILPEATASAEQRKINAQWIEPTDGERLTLVSCWPRDNNTHRIIVVAYPVQ